MFVQKEVGFRVTMSVGSLCGYVNLFAIVWLYNNCLIDCIRISDNF